MKYIGVRLLENISQGIYSVLNEYGFEDIEDEEIDIKKINVDTFDRNRYETYKTMLWQYNTLFGNDFKKLDKVTFIQAVKIYKAGGISYVINDKYHLSKFIITLVENNVQFNYEKLFWVDFSRFDIPNDILKKYIGLYKDKHIHSFIIKR